MPETLKPDELVERYERAAQNVERHAKKRECWPGDNDYDDAASALRDASSRILALQSDLERVTAERDHWQANHAEMVARNRVLRDRPDLPVDRLPAIAHFEARATTAEAAIVKARTIPWPGKQFCEIAERNASDLGRYIKGEDDRQVVNDAALAIRTLLALSAGEEENGR